MENILGVDLGSGSIGIAIRDQHAGNSIQEQLRYFSSDIFQSGVGKDKTGEYSFAAERTSCRLKRRMNDVRRRKLWATLALLIEHGLCPMSEESLMRWKTYDKSRGLFRQYPIDDKPFAQWIQLDFDGDGVADFSSPYQLRRELIETQLDFSEPTNRYMLGRALYHIAQHRGFKSSKGETINKKESSRNGDEGLDVAQEMKKSETEDSKKLVEYMEQHGLQTAGQAFAYLELDGERIRNNATYKAVRSQFMDEIKAIFNFQEGLSTDSDLYRRLMSTKKGEGTIFYKKPLRSQKGLVGKCTLEPSKSRCPASHPFYEIFKAWSILNNIKCRLDDNHDWAPLTQEQKEQVFFDLFVQRVKSNFKFEEVRKYLEKNILKRRVSAETGCAINYKDTQSLDGCPILARLYRLFDPQWTLGVDVKWVGTEVLIGFLEDKQFQGTKSRTAHGARTIDTHLATYSPLDVWHICYEANEPEDVEAVAVRRLAMNEDQVKQMLRIWSTIAQGYASLSLKAITNINRFLITGLKYNDAVLLAKIPDIAHIDIDEAMKLVDEFNSNVRERVDYQWHVANVVNTLIANFKALPSREQFACKNYDYELDAHDFDDIQAALRDHFGAVTWAAMSEEKKVDYTDDVAQCYQAFFASHERTFLEPIKLDTAFKQFLGERFPQVPKMRWKKLYHHSDIALYPPQKSGEDRSKWRLGTPNVGSIRNPVVMRTLHKLRRKINYMLDCGMIAYDDTRVVVETAREFNDANMRWALETYQKKREDEKKQIQAILEEFFSEHGITREIGETDIDRVRYWREQGDEELLVDKQSAIYSSVRERDIKKYKLWKEQDCMCMYTGRLISLAELFSDNTIDIEHTIPRSLIFDNSDKNITVCDAHYNRAVKRNRIPTQLPNYAHSATIDGHTYSPIVGRLEMWKRRVEQLKEHVDFWASQSRRATTKERKDSCVRQRHLWRMEYEYWHDKVERFTMTEVKEGFRNSQLVDTRIITKYATLYLKSIFKRVDVQRGNDTAEFRKILGLQDMAQLKNRTKHSHHAIDAAVLTLIPVPARAKRLRLLFARIAEAKKLGNESEVGILQNRLRDELDDCGITRDVAQLGRIIEENILVNHHDEKTNALIPNLRRGKPGTLQRLVVKGKKRYIVAHGDSIRGRLHEETFFGAVQLPTPQGSGVDREYAVHEGKFVYSPEPKKSMVVRKKVAELKEAEIANIVDTRLRKMISAIVQRRMVQGMTFAEAIATDMWMLDRHGNEIKQDRHGRPLRPLRHVRCLVKGLTYTKSVQVRNHNQASTRRLVNVDSRDHKQYVYAKNDTMYLFFVYEAYNNGRTARILDYISLFEIAKVMKGQITDDFESFFKNEPYYATKNVNGIEYQLTAVIPQGTKVLLWYDSPEELREMEGDNAALSKRLYVINNFNDRVFLKYHLSDDKGSIIRLFASSFNCLIEHRDFEMDLAGRITFK